jgi:hypothetical protein
MEILHTNKNYTSRIHYEIHSCTAVWIWTRKLFLILFIWFNLKKKFLSKKYRWFFFWNLQFPNIWNREISLGTNYICLFRKHLLRFSLIHPEIWFFFKYSLKLRLFFPQTQTAPKEIGKNWVHLCIFFEFCFSSNPSKKCLFLEFSLR